MTGGILGGAAPVAASGDSPGVFREQLNGWCVDIVTFGEGFDQFASRLGR